MLLANWQKLSSRTRMIIISAAATAAVVLIAVVAAVSIGPERAPIAWGGKAVAKAGDVVSIEYTGTLDDGTVFDTSKGRKPLQFALGRGKVIPGFDKAVTGMKTGEAKTVHIPVDEAYGPHEDALIEKVDRSMMPADLKLEVGQLLQAVDEAGEARQVKILALDDKSVTLDGNHPLAGKDLNFQIELVAIN